MVLLVAGLLPAVEVPVRSGLGEKEFRRARRYGYPISVVMLEVDEFKSINDRHGDAAGDAALKAMAALCASTLRQHDVIGRHGGDQFAISASLARR